jgi:hypothetical protein
MPIGGPEGGVERAKGARVSGRSTLEEEIANETLPPGYRDILPSREILTAECALPVPGPASLRADLLSG